MIQVFVGRLLPLTKQFKVDRAYFNAGASGRVELLSSLKFKLKNCRLLQYPDILVSPSNMSIGGGDSFNDKKIWFEQVCFCEGEKHDLDISHDSGLLDKEI